MSCNYVDKDINIKNKEKCLIRVATYNVHGFYDRGMKERLDNVMENIKKVNPDIIIIQEVFYGLKNLVTKQILKNKLNSFGLHNIIFSECGLNCIASSLSFDHKLIKFKPDPCHKEQRNAIIANFYQLDLTFVGTHLDVYDESGQTREDQIIDILKNVQQCSKIIVAGDLNTLRRTDYSNNEWLDIVQEAKIRNVKAKEDVVTVLEKNNFIDSFIGSKQKPPILSVWSGRRVDFIFGKNIKFKYSDVVQNTASDHFMIYSDIN
jgi:endonuclease/exonuclease/phosphatase family metal-dependent hydrolase